MHPETIKFTDGIPVKGFVGNVGRYPYHWHGALEIVQVLKGSVNISMGNDDLLLHENDIAVVNMDELHRLTGDGEDEILFIHIDDSFCHRVLPDNRYLFIFCCSAYHEAQAPEKYTALKDHITRLLQALNEDQRGEGKKSEESKENIKRILASMLGYLTYNFDFLRWGYGTAPFDEKIVERLRQIAEHASSGLEVQLSLKKLAAEAGVSLQHLSHDIKAKFGLTFLELLYYSRCAHAAKLLLSTDKRIIDIALECGFSDVKYLIKHFKQNFKHTPSEFRKMYRGDHKSMASRP